MQYIYLASPYTHPDPAIRLDRYHRVAAVAGKLMLQGDIVFCAITHSHQIGIAIDLPVDFDFWMKQDRPFLVHATDLYVLTLPGWAESKGVNEEISLASQLDMHVWFIDENLYMSAEPL